MQNMNKEHEAKWCPLRDKPCQLKLCQFWIREVVKLSEGRTLEAGTCSIKALTRTMIMSTALLSKVLIGMDEIVEKEVGA